MFNQFANPTTYVSLQNLPQVAGVFKNTLCNISYASNTNWYNDMLKAVSVKDIFGLLNVGFTMVDNNKFYPVIKNVDSFTYKSVLEHIAPYMSDGCLYVQDEYHFYTIKFEGGKIKGSRRKIEDGNPLTTPAPVSTPATTTPPKTTATKTPTKTPSKTPTKTTSKSYKKSYNNSPKKYGKTEVRTSTNVAAIQARDDNRYTVQELVKELLRQMDNGNGNKYLEVKADFLFKNEKYA